MKICFSTLGCPDWSWEEILAAAKDLGYDGIELRGLGNEIYARPSHFFLKTYRHQNVSYWTKGLRFHALLPRVIYTKRMRNHIYRRAWNTLTWPSN